MADEIHSGDLVYLSLDGGDEQYVATVYTGKLYWFPTFSSSKVKLKITFNGTHLIEGAYVKLASAEPRVGLDKPLSAYKNENCYYYEADTTHQQWQVHSVTSPDQAVRYGDGIILTNIYYSPERLVPNGSYLTTKVVSDTDSTWVISKA